MTAQAALTAALRERLAPRARDRGFKGSMPTWRKSNDLGDWALVNVQSSSWSTADALRCVVNVSAVPEPWLRWMRFAFPKAVPKQVGESSGLYRHRLHPTDAPAGVDTWWEVGDTSSANRVADDIVLQLERSGWIVLDGLMHRDGWFRRLHEGDLGDMKRSNFDAFFAQVEAVLLMDQGPSADLDSCLSHALKHALPSKLANAQRFDRWVRDQASLAHNS